MKQLMLAAALFVAMVSRAQSDKIYFHNGKITEGSVVKISAFTISYKNTGEEVERTASKYAIDRIVYGKNGQTEIISSRISILSADDWQKVVILDDNSEISELKKGIEIYGQASQGMFDKIIKAEAVASEELKKEAAAKNYPFVLLKSDFVLGGAIFIKKGMVYTY